MTTKQYIEKARKEIKDRISELTETLRTKKRLFNIGTVITALAGIGALTSSFWVALPLFGLTGALLLGKANADKQFSKSIKNLEDQEAHLNDVVKNGLNVNPEVNANRKKKMDSVELTRRSRNEEYSAADNKSRLANGAFIGTTILSFIVSNPILSILPIGVLLIKSGLDSTKNDKHAQLEDAGKELNNLIHEYNLANLVHASRAANGQTTTTTKRAPQPVQQTTKTRQATPATAPKKDTSQETIDAVDIYLRQLAQQKAENEGYQKRK